MSFLLLARVLLLIGFTVATAALYAQFVGLQTDPIRAILGFPHVSAEVPLGSRVTLVPGAGFIAPYNILDGYGDRVRGYNAELKSRVYLRGEGQFRGFALMAYLRFVTQRYREDASAGFSSGWEYDTRHLFFGLGAAYTLALKSGFTLSADLGIGRALYSDVSYRNTSASSGSHSTYRSPVDVNGTVTIGWRIGRARA